METDQHASIARISKNPITPLCEFCPEVSTQFFGEESVIIMGPSGAGKTTLGVGLSNLSDVPLLPQCVTRARRESDPPQASHCHSAATLIELWHRRRLAYFRRSSSGICHAYTKSSVTHFASLNGGSILIFNSLSGWVLQSKLVSLSADTPLPMIILDAAEELILERLRERDGAVSKSRAAAVYRDCAFNRAIVTMIRDGSRCTVLDASQPRSQVVDQAIRFLDHHHVPQAERVAPSSPGILDSQPPGKWGA